MRPVVRVLEAGLGPAGQVALVVSGLDDSDRLRGAWASSGATVERQGEGRLFATSTVDALARAAGRALSESEGRALEAAARRAVAAWTAPSPSLSVGSEVLDLSTPMVMGVLNVTPDSFADGGRLYPDDHPAAAIAVGQRLCAQGAGVIDVGGESTRPGSQPVGLEEELRRVLPVVLRLAADGRRVSIDTTKPEVARRAVEAGAVLVNDVSGGRDPALLEVVAGTGVGYVLMHTRGTPADMGARTDYGDVVAEVYEFLAEGIARCEAAGIAAERIVVDPGIGFAKSAPQSIALLRALAQFRGLGRPVLVGASRKSFLGSLLDGAPVEQRLEGSLAVAALAVARGAGVVRAHDVAETAAVVRVARALRIGE